MKIVQNFSSGKYLARLFGEIALSEKKLPLGHTYRDFVKAALQFSFAAFQKYFLPSQLQPHYGSWTQEAHETFGSTQIMDVGETWRCLILQTQLWTPQTG